MSDTITKLVERERRRSLCAQSLRVPLLLADGRRVHVVGVGGARAGLWPLLNEYASSHGGYDYDQAEQLEAKWEVVEQALKSTQKLEPQQVFRKPGPWMQMQEEHIFGYCAEGRIWRFESIVDHATFCCLTIYHGLPAHWLAWHQGTTSNWPGALDKYPVLTRRDWQRLTCQQEEGDPAELQDPVPLLERYAAYCQAGKMLQVVPCTLGEANAYVKRHHSHNAPVDGALYAQCVIGCDGVVRGVSIMGRPIARMLDTGKAGEMKRRILEVRRVATDGLTWNACSMLYGAARRLAKEAGFERVITYTLASEQGTCLRAAGWNRVAFVKGGQWTRERREQTANPSHDPDKWRWECTLGPSRAVAHLVFPTEEKRGG